MNRETRTFIWGLIIILLCGTSSVCLIFHLIDGEIAGLFGYPMLIVNLLGFSEGARKVLKTTN